MPLLILIGLMFGLTAWAVTDRLGAAVLAFCVSVFHLLVLFFYWLGAPIWLLIVVEAYAGFAAWWTWRNLFVAPRTVRPIILSQAPDPRNFGWWLLGQFGLGATPSYDNVAVWIRGLLAGGVAAFLVLVGLYGAPNPYLDESVREQSQRAMERNSVSTSDPAGAYREGARRPPIHRSPRTYQDNNWVNTDDLSDWSDFVKRR